MQEKINVLRHLSIQEDTHVERHIHAAADACNEVHFTSACRNSGSTRITHQFLINNEGPLIIHNYCILMWFISFGKQNHQAAVC